MRNQDFERYADVKSMVGPVSATWESVFLKELKARDFSDYRRIKFLDYGCGDGRYFPYLIQKGFPANNIYGIEVSKKRFQRCRRLGWENCSLVALKERLPYPDDFFDIINFDEVIEHIPFAELDFYLGEISRIMKPEALLILTTPNYPVKRLYDFVDAVWSGKWARLRDDPTHVCRYNKKRLKETLGRYFSNIRFYMYKEGVLYKRIKADFFMHKILAIISNT